MADSNNSHLKLSKEEVAGEKKDASKRNNKRPSDELADNHMGGVTDNDPTQNADAQPEPKENGKPIEEDFDEEGEEGGGEDTEEEEEDEEGEDGEKANQPRQPRQLVYTRPGAETIIIECSDDELLEVEKAVAIRMSVALRKKLESLEPNGILQLDNITGRALSKVMEYCHVHTAPHIISMDLKTWDDKFVKLDPGTLCELASAAYHLEIKPLVDLTCQAIAQLLKGKSPAEIRRTFNILYDFNPEDDAPPPTMRDKLRNKLCNPKRREKTKQVVAPPAPPPKEPVDTRSVDELVSFINQGTATKTKSKASKAAKRARQRERKKQRKNQERLRDSQENDGEKESESDSLSNSKEKEKEKNNKGSLSKSQEKEASKQMNEPIEPKETNSEQNQPINTQQPKANGLKRSGESTGEAKDSKSSAAKAAVQLVNGEGSDTGVKSSNGKKRTTGGQQQGPIESKKSKNLAAEASLRKGKSKQSPREDTEDDLCPAPAPASVTPDDDIWQEEDEDDMDPELKAQQDREVEEFRMRLEQINNTTNRTRIPLPSTLSLALIDTLKG